MVSTLDRRISKPKVRSKLVGLVAVDVTLEESDTHDDVLHLQKTIAKDDQEVARNGFPGSDASMTEEASEVG